MYLTEIFKIVVSFAGTLDSVVEPRIFFRENEAREFAKYIQSEGFYEGKEVGDVIVYREVPDTLLGWFRTAGMFRVEEV